MAKHIKKVLAVVLVLAMAASILAINTSAAAEVNRVTDAIAGVVDGVETSDDIEEVLGVDVSTLIDTAKGIGDASVDNAALSEAIANDVPEVNGENITETVNAAVDAVASSSNNVDAIDKDDLSDVVTGLGSSDVASDVIDKVIDALVDSVDINADKTKVSETLKLIVASIRGGKVEPATTTVSNDSSDNWIGTWSTSMVEGSVALSGQNIKVSLSNVTARTRIMSTREGDIIRLCLSNKYGTQPLTIKEITVALANEKVERAIQTGTLVKATVGGNESVTIPAGQVVYTDPIKFHVEACQEMMVSMYFENISEFSTVGLINGHSFAGLGNQTEKYVSPANIDLSAENLSVGAYEILPILSNVDVYDEDPNAYSVVVFGDSTTTNTTVLKLATLLKANGITNVGVLLQGIKGNEVLHDGIGTIGSIMGKSALSRFDNDVLAQPGVKKVLIKVGLNDIFHPMCESKKDDYPDFDIDKLFDQMTAAYSEMINKAKAQGLEVYFATRTPGRGYTRNILGITGDDISDETYTTIIEPYRNQINNWLRQQAADGVLNGLVDLDCMMDTDPDRVGALRPDYTLDGAHLTDLGCQVFAKTAYPVLFGESKTNLDDVDLSNTISYGGIDNDLKPFLQLLQKIFDVNNSGNGKLDLTALSKLIALIKNGSKDDVTSDTVESIIKDTNPDADVSDKLINDIKDLINNSASEDGNSDLTYSQLLKLISGISDDASSLDTAAIKDLLEMIRGNGNGSSDNTGSNTSTKDDSASKADDSSKADDDFAAAIKAETKTENDPQTEETLEDVEIVNDLMLTDDSTPLGASAGFTALTADDIVAEKVAQTGDTFVPAGVTLAITASAAAIVLLKKKEH